MEPTLRVILAVALLSSDSITLESQGVPESRCAQAASDPVRVPDCLRAKRLIDASSTLKLNRSLASAESLSAVLHRQHDEMRAITVDSAMARFVSFYRLGQLRDTARLNRLGDHLDVTMQFAAGRLKAVGNRYYSDVTPGLSWHFYPSTGAGLFPHVFETVQALGSHAPDSLTANTDLLLVAGEAIWKYATWDSSGPRRFPVWEHLFKNEISDPGDPTFRHLILPPWRSSMPQGEAMRLFTVLYQRTGDREWARRAQATLVSFDTPWSLGGVRLDDTTHGYWFEEALPDAMIWNGSMQALIDVGVYARTFPSDSMSARLWKRGLASALYFTPTYDTGTWLRYSHVQGNVSARYRNYAVALAAALGRLSGDSTWTSNARRWAAYRVPLGTCVNGPCADGSPAAQVP